MFTAADADGRIPNETWVIVGSVAEPTITNFHLTWRALGVVDVADELL